MSPDLAIVTKNPRIPREQWGEAWMCLMRCAARFDPTRRTKFNSYFLSAWSKWRINVHRKNTTQAKNFCGKPIIELQMLSFENGDEPFAAPKQREREEMPDAPVETPADECLHLLCRGNTYAGLSLALGIPEGTVKSRGFDSKHKLRKRLEAA